MESQNADVDFIVFNVKDHFNIGGLSPALRVRLDKEQIEMINSKLNELTSSDRMIYFVDCLPSKHKIQNPDILIVFNDNLDKIALAIPNYIKTKDTSKPNGIIVCSYLEYYILQNKEWEYQTLGKFGKSSSPNLH